MMEVRPLQRNRVTVKTHEKNQWERATRNAQLGTLQTRSLLICHDGGGQTLLQVLANGLRWASGRGMIRSVGSRVDGVLQPVVRSQKEHTMDRVELAVSLFKQGFSCSQAVLAAYGECFGLDRDLALRVAAGFGGGMGRMAQTCGAVTGAFMLIGMRYGNVDARARQEKERTYELVREFADRFHNRHGSLICRELLGYDMSTPDGFQAAGKRKSSAPVCEQLVRDAATLIEQMV